MSARLAAPVKDAGELDGPVAVLEPDDPEPDDPDPDDPEPDDPDPDDPEPDDPDPEPEPDEEEPVPDAEAEPEVPVVVAPVVEDSLMKIPPLMSGGEELFGTDLAAAW